MSNRILAVYRNEGIRRGIQGLLQDTEADVQVAASRQEALVRALLEPFDLAIVERGLIDGRYGRQFKERLNELGIPVLLAAPEAAWQSPEEPVLPAATLF